jgi:hypothetical protein
MAGEQYVTNDAWVRSLGRPDAIDEIADQFERPVAAVGMESFWSREQARRRQPLTVGPTRSIANRTITRWSRSIAAR